MSICITASYQIRPEFSKECKKVIKDLVDHVKENEPGILFYLARQDILDPMSFHHTIIFKDEAALDVHQSSPASKRFVDYLYPKTVEPLDFGEYNVIAFKSSDDHSLQ
jgi:quinol monooxygenase YgiN